MRLIAIAALVLAAPQAPPASGVGRKFQDPALLPLLQGTQVLVVAFSAADCPISKLCRPKLDRLEKDYRGKPVRFFAAASDDAVYAPLLELRRTTEVFVFDDGGTLRYRGAVDDQYGIGYQKDAPTKTWLVDAVEALLAGKPVPVTSTEAPGCAVERAGKAATSSPKAAGSRPTYHKDVAPILQRRCVDCHRPGEIGPFSLLKYEGAKRNAAQIREVVLEKRMPPWHADPKHGEWKNDRRLTPAEISTIAAWADAGAPEGSSADGPAPRKFVEGWTIGAPDVVWKMPRAERVPAEGTIPYRYQEIPTGLREDRWVQAMEVRAGAKPVVHHILVFVKYPLDRLREQPPLDGGLQHGYFGIMVPGESPLLFPEGMGKKLPAGATLVFQVHYSANGTAAEDQSSIGILWAKKPVKQEVITRGIVNTMIRIPAGAAAHPEQAAFTFTHDARLLSLLPHMHVRGKAFRYVAVGPDGKEEILLDIPAYDFNWQTCYRFKEPKLVRKGTRIRAFAVYDNSRNNPANPDPSREVRFGEQTWEEMLIGYMDFVKVGE